MINYNHTIATKIIMGTKSLVANANKKNTPIVGNEEQSSSTCMPTQQQDESVAQK